MASITYLFENFNNYYNRIIKRFDKIDDYISNSTDYAVRGNDYNVLFENKGPVNFNINDGITATIRYNYDPNQIWQPDYVVICELDKTILSRWFVMEAQRTRQGQYVITLRRDVIADNYYRVIEAPTFIEKATLNRGSKFIFNPENMTYNQIKKDDELLLKDSSNSAWIVGYVASPQANEDDTVVTAKISHDIDIVTTLNKEAWLQNTTRTIYNSNNYQLECLAEGQSLFNQIYKYTFDIAGANCDTDPYGRHPNTYAYREKNSASATRVNILDYVKKNQIESQAKTLLDSSILTNKLINVDETSLYWNNNNKLIQFVDGSIYQISVKTSTVNQGRTILIESNAGALYQSLLNMSNTVFQSGHGTSNPYFLNIVGNVTTISYVLTPVSGQYLEFKTTISIQRKELNDAPYCMFCIPYNQITYFKDAATTQESDMGISLAMARKIAETLTQKKCYDVQLLPFCPRQDMIRDGKINSFYKTFTEHYDYEFIKDTSDSVVLGIILWCSTSQGGLSINRSIEVPDDPIDFKVENETTFYRLCSPNNAASFEFKATMNNGVEFFNVDYCYKPYQPYIHINPNFANLYGVDTNDFRGLICAGDFSLPQTSDAYASYVLNNKNYQETFNRQIDNMNVMHKYQMIEQGIGAASSALGTGISTGVKTGNVAGGVVAGALSLAGGAADLAMSQEKFKETIDYTKDQFGFTLGNVQARPDTLSKVSGYNPNNKIFPYIEKYTCTDEEKTALKNKLYYNGMTVGIIDKIANYLQPDYSYIKGKIIRIENASDDYHNVEIIAEELNKGVFIK